MLGDLLPPLVPQRADDGPIGALLAAIEARIAVARSGAQRLGRIIIRRALQEHGDPLAGRHLIEKKASRAELAGRDASADELQPFRRKIGNQRQPGALRKPTSKLRLLSG